MRKIQLEILLVLGLFTAGAVGARDSETASGRETGLLPDSGNAAGPSVNARIETLCREKRKGQVVLGYSKGKLPVEALFFPGTGAERALVIGGMHGSELSSIDVAKMVVAQLESGSQPYYNVIVIPSLFPDNAKKAMTSSRAVNFGRYTSRQHADPNRQMPALGTSFDPSAPFDAQERPIEMENRYLLELIQFFRPTRIVNLHAIRDTSRAGIFADPRTDCSGNALGFETDEELALRMARFINDNGGHVPGNSLQEDPSALYYMDPKPAPRGQWQKRNVLGSKLKGNRGAGVSLGGWAASAVCKGAAARDAIQLFTLEFPGYRSYLQCTGVQQANCFLEVYLYAASITRVFLASGS